MRLGFSLKIELPGKPHIGLLPMPQNWRPPTRAAGSGVLFDHLVGAVEQRGQNGEPERPGGLEIDGTSR
jgi:hypothetical protein